MGIGQRLGRARIAGQQPLGGRRGGHGARAVTQSGERGRQRQLGVGVGRIEAHGGACGLGRAARLGGIQPLPRLGQQPVTLARVVAGEASVLGRRIAVRPTRRKRLCQQLAVADLVGVQPDGVGGVPLRLIDPAQRQQGARPQLVGGVVPRSFGQQRVGEPQHVLVVAAIQRFLDRCHRRRGLGH